MAYVECASLLARNEISAWCDCMITNSPADDIPITQKQADIQIKTDWKFIPEHQVKLSHWQLSFHVHHQAHAIPDLSEAHERAVFRPPLA